MFAIFLFFSTSFSLSCLLSQTTLPTFTWCESKILDRNDDVGDDDEERRRRQGVGRWRIRASEHGPGICIVLQ